MNDILPVKAWLDSGVLKQWAQSLYDWLFDSVFIADNLIQLLFIFLAFIISRFLGKKTRDYLRGRFQGRFDGQTRMLNNLFRSFLELQSLLFMILLTWVCIHVAARLQYPSFVLGLVETLLVAWVIIKAATSVIPDPFWARMIALSAWILAAANIVGLLDPAMDLLSGLGFSIGDVRLNALSVIKALVVFFAMLKIGVWLGDYLERKVKTITDLTPSTHVLLGKIIKIGVFTFVLLTALNSVGIDFTALAVFSGAVGVGVGFGLQKVVANFVSGIILLIDKSIKPGDVIQIGDLYGWITNLRGRFVSVVTRDGKEFLIPNEDLITQQVINWSFSDRQIRLKIPIGVSYKSDVKKAISLILEAAKQKERVLEVPEPVCHLIGFGENSVDLELRFWINDPQNGVVNSRSRILLGIWDKFNEHGIEIPFPQRDVHLDLPPSFGSLNISGKGTD